MTRFIDGPEPSSNGLIAGLSKIRRRYKSSSDFFSGFAQVRLASGHSGPDACRLNEVMSGSANQ